MTDERPLTRLEADARLRQIGWRLTGTRAEGYCAVTLPEHGSCSTGPFDTPQDAFEAILADEQAIGNV